MFYINRILGVKSEFDLGNAGLIGGQWTFPAAGLMSGQSLLERGVDRDDLGEAADDKDFLDARA